MARKRRRTRQLIIAKRKKGGFLPVLAAIGALSSIAGGAAGLANQINSIKNRNQFLQEIKRHNAAMEGKGLFLRPYRKKGKGMRRRKKKAGERDDRATAHESS